MLSPWRLLLWELAVKLPYHVITASLCLGGSDIFATVRENSPMGQFISDLSISGDPGANTVRLCLGGKNADWLFLDGKTIRLNASHSRVLDREVQGAILLAELICYEDDVMQSYYRVIVEVLNENDNTPQFVEKTIQPLFISELAAVNSVVFTVTATDADQDTLVYVVDTSSPDASYFRIDLPNSGHVVLDKPLDYESKTQLQLVIYAVEMKTTERYNATATMTVHIKDGDDQYPQFLPCNPAAVDVHLHVCTNPVYTANITEADQDIVLEFSPGAIHAVDGDRGLKTPLKFTLLSGADNGRFAIDNETGEIRLTRRVDDTAAFRLRIMASQLDDPRKYSVATALVRVLAENSFPPTFNRTTYKGFVIKSDSPATIVSRYGNLVLLVHATDMDFVDGLNPKIVYTLQPRSASEGLYDITREGIIIARTERLKAFDRHILEVVARDEESGERATASLDIEVLQRGQSVPSGQFQEEPLFGDVDTTLAGAISAILLVLFVTAVLLTVHTVRRRGHQQNPVEQGALTLGKHPNVVNPSQAEHTSAVISFTDVSCSAADVEHSRSECLRGRPGLYTRKQSLLPPPLMPRPEAEGVSCGVPPKKHPLAKGVSPTSANVSETVRKVPEEEEAPHFLRASPKATHSAMWRIERMPTTDGFQMDHHRAADRKPSISMPTEEDVTGRELDVENPYAEDDG